MNPFEVTKELKQNIKEYAKEAKNYIFELQDEFLVFLKNVNLKSKDLLKTNYDLGMYHLARGNLTDAKLRFTIVFFI